MTNKIFSSDQHPPSETPAPQSGGAITAPDIHDWPTCSHHSIQDTICNWYSFLNVTYVQPYNKDFKTTGSKW